MGRYRKEGRTNERCLLAVVVACTTEGVEGWVSEEQAGSHWLEPTAGGGGVGQRRDNYNEIDSRKEEEKDRVRLGRLC